MSASILSIAQLKKQQELGLSATELLRETLLKISHDQSGSFLRLAEKQASQAAQSADRVAQSAKAPPLNGIPIGVKDALLTIDIESNSASKMLAGFIPPYEATAVVKLRQAGAVMVGKTNMDEFAMGSSTENSAFGPVRNPWDLSRVPGGSSGGSAAAVAAALVPACLGTDTGGSIRQPAAYCGVVGLKPTYGRVSRYGVIAFASSLDQVGVLGKTVADCALVAEQIAGHDPHDATSVAMPVPEWSQELGGGLRGLRVGIPREYFVAGLQKEVAAAVKEAIEQLAALGATVVEISLPHTEYAMATYYIIAPAEASSNLSRYDGVRFHRRAAAYQDLADLYRRSRTEGFGPEVKRRIMIGTYVLSTGYYDAYYRRAQKVRRLIAEDFEKAFSENCDLVACPTTPTTAFTLGEKMEDPLAMYLNDVFTVPVNLAGLPALSLPCGFDKQQLPIGLQLIGRPWEEGVILRAAHAYEQATDWHKRLPPG